MNQTDISTDTNLVTVSVEHLDFSVPSRSLAQRCLPCFFEKPVDLGRTHLLKDIYFVARPNELTAIIGPSGCGKTTLLNVIADRARGHRDSGSVYFSGVEGKQKHLSNVLSLVYASDRMLPYLTVTETLMFAAVLRLGQTTMAMRREKVEIVLRELALSHVKDTPVGGVWKKGLSTGEMRRLSIAQELITKPSILLLDEPTSGLDAVLAYEVMYVLRQVARRGRTVICTIHQPRSSVFELFDQLMLMGRGRSLYTGPAKSAIAYFTRDFSIRHSGHESASEFLIDIASENTRQRRRIKKEDSPATAVSETDSDDGLECDNLADRFAESKEYASVLQECQDIRLSPDPSVFKSKIRNAFVQWWLEFYAVAYRSFRNSYRNPLAFVVVFGVQVFVGLFLGAIFYRLPSKFLPDHRPIDIGDPESAAMKAFDTTIAHFFTTGIDGNRYNPLLEMLVEGVDGQGSQPFDDFSKSFIAGPFGEMPECTHKVLGLKDMAKYSYANNLTDYSIYWDPQTPDSKTAPDYVASIIQGLQVVDYVIADVEWNQIMQFGWDHKGGDVIFGLKPIYLWPECVGRTGEVLDVMATCSGVYPRPPWGGVSLVHSTCNAFRKEWIQNVTNANVDYPGPSESRYFPTTLSEAVPTPSSLKDRPAEERRLQAASLIGGGLGSFIDFLPPIALDMFAKVSTYMEILTSCDHPFCAALENAMNRESEGTSIRDYAAVMGAVLNIAGALFFSVANVGFASYDALVSFPQERVIFNREVSNKMYKPGSYFLGKSFSDLLFQFIPAIGLVTTFFFLVDLGAGPHASYFFKYLGICILVSYTSYGFAYMISAVSKTMEIAVTAAPLILVVFLCCSGFFVRDSAVPSWMVWVKYISLYRWGFFALMINQFPPDGSYYGLPNSFSLALAGITETRLWVCLLWLFGLGTAFRVLAFMALKWTNRRVGIEQ